MIRNYIIALRPQQWVKNLFIFIPAFFAGELFNFSLFPELILAFASFSLISSSVYVLNDLKDIENDKKHPLKKDRPIASGKVSKASALILFFLCGVTAISLGFYLNFNFFIIVISYWVLNIFYSFGLKKISILDIMIIATGFVLRIVSGGIVASIQISSWLVVMIFLLALFLAIAKRRDDILVFLESGKIMRKSIENYNLEFVNSVLILISGIIMVSYIMYTISTEVSQRMHSDYLYLTSIFVIAGLMRYLQIIFVENDSGSPVRILYADRFIQITLLCWILSFYLIIYVGQ